MCIANKFPADADAAVPGKLGHGKCAPSPSCHSRYTFPQLSRFSVMWVETQEAAPAYMRNPVKWPHFSGHRGSASVTQTPPRGGATSGFGPRQPSDCEAVNDRGAPSLAGA